MIKPVTPLYTWAGNAPASTRPTNTKTVHISPICNLNTIEMYMPFQSLRHGTLCQHALFQSVYVSGWLLI
jgi:hypothetical protein